MCIVKRKHLKAICRQSPAGASRGTQSPGSQQASLCMWLTLLDYSLDRVRFTGKEVKSTGRYHVTNYPHLTGRHRFPTLTLPPGMEHCRFRLAVIHYYQLEWTPSSFLIGELTRPRHTLSCHVSTSSSLPQEVLGLSCFRQP